MPRTPIISHETYAPNQEEVSLAKETYEKLVSMVENQHELQIKISKAGSQCEEITLPASALGLLMNFLKEMAKGNTVSVIPVEMEFTTQQAADFLNVSRPYLVRLLDKGQIFSRKVGSHRRVLFQDLQKFKEKNLEERRKVLDQLAEQAHPLDMGY